jgi:pimeloyl-ACP methyl ester carboxylesterase
MRIEHQQVAVGSHDLHVATSGDPDAPPYVFLHGWPECWIEWHEVMAAASDVRCIAIDLPGIGASRGAVEGGRKVELANLVFVLVEQLALKDVTIVGHDAGGMIAYAYLRSHPAARVVVVNTVIPGVDPWSEVISNPTDWHWSFHNTPHLPELLVKGRELGYFSFFYDFLSAKPKRITAERRAQYAAAYSDDAALHAGFELYRGMADDAKTNQAGASSPCDTPLLYIRGDKDLGGTIDDYAAGFRKVGVRNLETAKIADCGHFVADEQPGALWDAIARSAHRKAA